MMNTNDQVTTIKDLIIGVHSVYHALSNPKRSLNTATLYVTAEGLSNFHSLYPTSNKIKVNQVILSAHDFQDRAKKVYQDFDFEWSRIQSQMLLVIDSIAPTTEKLIEMTKNKSDLKIVALDQITDIQNAGAITRSAAFYNVDAIIYGSKNSFRLTPAYFRISSGGAEYVPLFCVASLSKWLKKFNENQINVYALTEGGQEIKNTDQFLSDAKQIRKKVLVFGEEEKGISHACLMNSTYKLRLDNQGPITTLNVSNACAITMEKFWGI